MWIPATAEELESRAASGDLVETPTFDGKVSLPARKKNVDLAIDVSAMTVEGGVLVYGLGEDADKRLTDCKPFELAGAAERIDQIVQTCISETPLIEIRRLELASDPSRGYLAVVIPQSGRAPHQVTVGSELRYYGRGATGNRILTEGEVALLYRRREEWERSAADLLEEEIARAPYGPIEGLGFMHGFVRPLAPDEGVLDRAAANDHHTLFWNVLPEAMGRSHNSGRYDPDIRRARDLVRRGSYGWTVTNQIDEGHRDPANAVYTVTMDIDEDGSGHLFLGRAAETYRERLIMIEVVIAGNLASFLAAMGTLYDRAGYAGQVDVGVAVLGIEGSVALGLGERVLSRPTYGAPDYRRTARVSAGELRDAPQDVARRLLQRLIDVMTVGDFDPFTGA